MLQLSAPGTTYRKLLAASLLIGLILCFFAFRSKPKPSRTHLDTLPDSATPVILSEDCGHLISLNEQIEFLQRKELSNSSIYAVDVDNDSIHRNRKIFSSKCDIYVDSLFLDFNGSSTEHRLPKIKIPKLVKLFYNTIAMRFPEIQQRADSLDSAFVLAIGATVSPRLRMPYYNPINATPLRVFLIYSRPNQKREMAHYQYWPITNERFVKRISVHQDAWKSFVEKIRHSGSSGKFEYEWRDFKCGSEGWKKIDCISEFTPNRTDSALFNYSGISRWVTQDVDQISFGAIEYGGEWGHSCGRIREVFPPVGVIFDAISIDSLKLNYDGSKYAADYLESEARSCFFR